MLANWILQPGFPRTTSYIFIYVHCYICCGNSVDFERSNAYINTTITWWSFVSCRGVKKSRERQPADLWSRSNWITDSWRTCCAVVLSCDASVRRLGNKFITLKEKFDAVSKQPAKISIVKFTWILQACFKIPFLLLCNVCVCFFGGEGGELTFFQSCTKAQFKPQLIL